MEPARCVLLQPITVDELLNSSAAPPIPEGTRVLPGTWHATGDGRCVPGLGIGYAQGAGGEVAPETPFRLYYTPAGQIA